MCWRLGDIEAKVVYYSSLGRKSAAIQTWQESDAPVLWLYNPTSGGRWLERAWPSICATWQSLPEAIVAKGLAER